MDTADILSGNFEFYDFVRVYAALLNEAVTGDDDEELPLAMVPVLAFSDAGLRDIDADLTAV